jgi:hypothetical protein
VNRKTLIATVVAMPTTPAVAVLLALSTPAAALAAGRPAVTVRVEGLKHTLLAPKLVRAHSGWITRFGAPKGACSANSGQGALDVATHHRWRGKWSTQFGPEYEVTSILGETHRFTSKYFWEIFVNNVAATTGACELKLHRGERLLFAAVPQTGTEYPLGLRVLEKPVAGHPFHVHVVYFDAKGKPKPLEGATVTAGGISAEPIPNSRTSATTNSQGVATLTENRPGLVEITARKPGYIRAAPAVRNVS